MEMTYEHIYVYERKADDTKNIEINFLANFGCKNITR